MSKSILKGITVTKIKPVVREMKTDHNGDVNIMVNNKIKKVSMDNLRKWISC